MIDDSRGTAQESSRPLILVGHSFGGILVKKALMIAKGTEPSPPKLHIYDKLTVCRIGIGHSGEVGSRCFRGHFILWDTS